MTLGKMRIAILSFALPLSASGCRAGNDPTSEAGTNSEGSASTGSASTAHEEPSDETGDSDSDGVRSSSSGTRGGVADTTTGVATSAPVGDESDTGTTTGTTGDTTTHAQDSSAALDGLRAWLGLAWEARPPLDEQDFASIPLDREAAATAEELLWSDLAAHIEATRREEVESKTITHEGFTLRYETVALGAAPPEGRSLFISMHGGGSAPPETNDEQWRNQIALGESYMPQDALWIAPRAPTDDWNMWFKDHIDPMFDRLITNMIVFEGIDPNRVYLNGYSAGGDGVYQLGPRMADRFAACGMSAGHPNDASPLNLRNVGFALHVGGDDTAFSRNEIALEWGTMLDALQTQDPEGYFHQVQVHAGLPHWMNLADQVSIPFMQGFDRDVTPPRVVWLQPTVSQSRFYWLEVPTPEPGTQIDARLEGQTIHVDSTGVRELDLRLSDAMLDLDAPVTVMFGDTVIHEDVVPRTIGVLHETLMEREDPAAMFAGELSVTLQP